MAGKVQAERETRERSITQVVTDDGVTLHVEQTGAGTPILFIHEFAGDARSWSPQTEHFSHRYRCVTYNARGYPPSEVPDDVERYSQARAVDDARDVIRALNIEGAHVVGLSMGGFCALHLGLRYPELVSSLVIAGCGYGAQPQARDAFRRESAVIAAASAPLPDTSPTTSAHSAPGCQACGSSGAASDQRTSALPGPG